MFRKLKRLLPFCCFGFACLVKDPLLNIQTFGIYFLIANLVILATSYYFDIVGWQHEKKIIKVEKSYKDAGLYQPEAISKFKDFISKEGFKIGIETSGMPYLRTNETVVRYVKQTGLIQKYNIIISPVDSKNNKECLLYSENEEFVNQLRDYLGFMYEKDTKIERLRGEYDALIQETLQIKTRGMDKIRYLWNASGRTSGYMFLVIGLLNVDSNLLTNAMKVLIVVSYFLIENF